MTEHLKIDFKRSGGFAGVELTTCVDVDELSEDESKDVRAMVERLDLDRIPQDPSSSPGVPDRFIYELKIEHGERTVDVCVGEAELPEDLKPLVRDLEKRAKRR